MERFVTELKAFGFDSEQIRLVITAMRFADLNPHRYMIQNER